MNTISPRRRTNVRMEALPDGSALLHDVEANAFYAINATAAITWELCMTGTTVDGIADQLALIFDVSAVDVRADVAALLDRFAELELLERDGR